MPLIERLQRSLSRKQEEPFTRATLDDLRACYRLFLRREPDPEGWAAWRDLVENHHITIQMMVDGFLSGPEFRRLQEEAARPVLVELDRFRLYVRLNDYFIGAAIARDRTYEPHVTSALTGLLRPGDTFLDVGANIGYFALLGAALVGPAGRVIAIEPNPHNCDLIGRSLEANGFAHVEIHPVALAEMAGTFALDVGGPNTNGRLVEVDPGADPAWLTVEAVVADDYLGELERLDVIKMDIEGAEPRALEGLAGLVRVHRPVILTEFSPALIAETSHVTPEAFLRRLAEWGYELSILGRDGGCDAPPGAPDILAAHGRSGLSHLDLLARPLDR